MAKSDDSPTATNVDEPSYESRAGVNLNYPSSVVNKPSYSGSLTPMSQYILNSYGQFNLPTALTGMNYMSPSVVPGGARLNSLLPSSSVMSSYLSGMNPMQLSMGTNS